MSSTACWYHTPISTEKGATQEINNIFVLHFFIRKFKTNNIHFQLWTIRNILCILKYHPLVQHPYYITHADGFVSCWSESVCSKSWKNDLLYVVQAGSLADSVLLFFQSSQSANVLSVLYTSLDCYTWSARQIVTIFNIFSQQTYHSCVCLL